MLVFIKKLRLIKPWRYKLPLLFSFCYLAILIGNKDYSSANIILLISIVSSIGFVAAAYFLNDLGDRKSDAIQGKENSTVGLNSLLIAIIVSCFVSLAIIPWLWIPFDRVSIAIIIAELLLFYAYSIKPFRLKERGFLGILADAFYAHLLPAILAFYTFILWTNIEAKALLFQFIFLGIWQSISGIRNIISHQIADFENDKKSEQKTWIQKIGIDNAETTIKRMLFLESFTFLIFLFSFWFYYPVILISYLTFIILRVLSYTKNFKASKLSSRKFFSNYFLDDFYILFFPVIVLFALLWESASYWIVLVSHLLLFNFFKKNQLLNLITLPFRS